ncbi:hypothetical protein PIB30_060312 [Stylosanthes scabra]|uniref:CCHC-type domain-containing protein n=1 Tax=Stylosanthes scabra TaxID=79078 RepID=A0ABU6SLV4_9FABA|nr:hypothetical protein [Stylosanthes scabra]
MTILDPQSGKTKKKSLALKASSQEEESDDNNEGEEDQDFALLMKQFNKFAKKKNFNFKGKKKSPKCYECGKIGHIKPNCPKFQKGEKDKKMKKKQKAYMSWENENEDLMKMNNDLQKENENLKVQNKTFEKAKTISNNESCESCRVHIHEIDKLNTCLAKFNESSKNLDNMLKNQKHVNDRKGIGYDTNKASTSQNEHKKTRKTIRQPQVSKANKAEFGAEGAGESERNERIATNLEGHCWSLCVRIPLSHAYASKRGRHAQMLISAPMRTHRSIPASINRGAFHHFKESPLPHLA